MNNSINSSDTIIIKVGTNVIATKDGLPDHEAMQNIADQIVRLKKHYKRVVLVSSGAVAFGRSEYNQAQQDNETTKEKQKLASAGQGLLIEAWRECFRGKCIVGQVLCEKEHFDNEKSSRNIQNTIESGFKEEENTISIVNENDSAATEELMFYDNDHLSYMLAKLLNANRVVFASCMNGVQRDVNDSESTIPSFEYKDKSWKKYVPKEAVSINGRGGMYVKCLVSRNLQGLGVTSYIINGREENALVRLLIDGEPLGTVFLPKT
ncbi:hypothetical protein KKC44_03725 [Patescibacteria group bacterium]|nr:hypothetical protein [Patescibacteria group bacterium]MBU2259690.1 hypothetical protein [Patescibacteria group bacterium]